MVGDLGVRREDAGFEAKDALGAPGQLVVVGDNDQSGSVGGVEGEQALDDQRAGFGVQIAGRFIGETGFWAG